MPDLQPPSLPVLTALDAALELPPFFANFPAETLKTFLPTLAFLRYAEGEAIVKQGEKGEEFYILLQGAASVRKRRSAEVEQEVAQLGPGDSFGEISVIASTGRSATIVALDGCLVGRLGQNDLQKVMERQPELAERLEAQARKRLSETRSRPPA